MSSMPHPDPEHSRARPRTTEEIILGVDTHKDIHVAAVVTTLGAQLADATFPTTAAGYRQLLAWARGFGVLAPRRGGGHRLLRRRADPLPAPQRRHRDRGQPPRPGRPPRTARPTPSTPSPPPAPSCPRRATTTAKTADGPVEMLRLFRLARASAVKARTQAINQLKAVIVSTDPQLRDTLTGLTGTALIRHCAEPAGHRTDRRGHRGPLHAAPAGPAHPGPHRRGTRAATPDHHRAANPRPATAATPRHRPRQRLRPARHRRRQPRPPAQRSILRRPLRRQPDRGILRQNPTPPAQPRRRPPRQRRPATASP